MIKTDIKSLLLGTDFFGGLADEVLDRLIELAVPMEVVRGDAIFREGERTESIYLLVAGRVEASVSSEPQGRKYVFMHSEAGELLGEVSYLDGGPCAWSVLAESDCRLLMFRRSDLVSVFGVPDGLPCESVRTKILMRLAGMVRRISTSAKNLALLDVYGRIRILFGELLVEEDGFWRLDKPLTQQEIADRIGSSREMVARILKELVYGHYIRMENRRIVLLKMLPEHF